MKKSKLLICLYLSLLGATSCYVPDRRIYIREDRKVSMDSIDGHSVDGTYYYKPMDNRGNVWLNKIRRKYQLMKQR